MRTNAWYNVRFWAWDIASWLCHYKIRECRDCMKARVYDEGYQQAMDDGKPYE